MSGNKVAGSRDGTTQPCLFEMVPTLPSKHKPLAGRHNLGQIVSNSKSGRKSSAAVDHHQTPRSEGDRPKNEVVDPKGKRRNEPSSSREDDILNRKIPRSSFPTPLRFRENRTEQLFLGFMEGPRLALPFLMTIALPLSLIFNLSIFSAKDATLLDLAQAVFHIATSFICFIFAWGIYIYDKCQHMKPEEFCAWEMKCMYCIVASTIILAMFERNIHYCEKHTAPDSQSEQKTNAQCGESMSTVIFSYLAILGLKWAHWDFLLACCVLLLTVHGLVAPLIPGLLPMYMTNDIVIGQFLTLLTIVISTLVIMYVREVFNRERFDAWVRICAQNDAVHRKSYQIETFLTTLCPMDQLVPVVSRRSVVESSQEATVLRMKISDSTVWSTSVHSNVAILEVDTFFLYADSYRSKGNFEHLSLCGDEMIVASGLRNTRHHDPIGIIALAKHLSTRTAYWRHGLHIRFGLATGEAALLTTFLSRLVSIPFGRTFDEAAMQQLHVEDDTVYIGEKTLLAARATRDTSFLVVGNQEPLKGYLVTSCNRLRRSGGPQDDVISTEEQRAKLRSVKNSFKRLVGLEGSANDPGDCSPGGEEVVVAIPSGDSEVGGRGVEPSSSAHQQQDANNIAERGSNPRQKNEEKRKDFDERVGGEENNEEDGEDEEDEDEEDEGPYFQEEDSEERRRRHSSSFTSSEASNLHPEGRGGLGYQRTRSEDIVRGLLPGQNIYELGEKYQQDARHGARRERFLPNSCWVTISLISLAVTILQSSSTTTSIILFCANILLSVFSILAPLERLECVGSSTPVYLRYLLVNIQFQVNVWAAYSARPCVINQFFGYTWVYYPIIALASRGIPFAVNFPFFLAHVLVLSVISVLADHGPELVWVITGAGIGLFMCYSRDIEYRRAFHNKVLGEKLSSQAQEELMVHEKLLELLIPTYVVQTVRLRQEGHRDCIADLLPDVAVLAVRLPKIPAVVSLPPSSNIDPDVSTGTLDLGGGSGGAVSNEELKAQGLKIRKHLKVAEEALQSLESVSSSSSCVSILDVFGDIILIGGPLQRADAQTDDSLLDASTFAQTQFLNAELDGKNKWADEALGLQASKNVLTVLSKIVKLYGEVRSSDGGGQQSQNNSSIMEQHGNGITAILHRDDGLGVVLGRQQPRFSLRGTASRVALGLLEAAPDGFLGCSQKFFSMLDETDPWDVLEELGVLRAVGSTEARQQYGGKSWRCRGLGLQRVVSFL